MHRLVHLATRNWLKNENLLQSWTGNVLQRMVTIIPFGGHDGREKWTAYLPHGMEVAHSLNQPKSMETKRVELRYRIGCCQQNFGQYKNSENSFRGVLELTVKKLGKENPDTLGALSNLAVTLSDQGKSAEAETMYLETLEMQEKVLGKEHPYTLTSMNNLAVTLRDQGKSAEAETMYLATLEMREKVLGMEHPDTLASMNDLAVTLRDQGKFAEAESH